MLLKSLKLENIRSYTSEKMQFPKGTVLLSGDIGSGKSSILLSVEFALFGVRKPDLTGQALLRKGAKTGSVELKLQIDDDEIIIRRVLKKTKNDIKQDAGYIIINGVRMDGTAVELKARVLELLGYPKDLLTKHKELIYRYTVYTPQEQMKAILFEDSQLRLGTLRKVFGIDKYKTVRENCLVYIRELRGRAREDAARIYDLAEKLEQLKGKNEESQAAEKHARELVPKADKAKKDLLEKKQAIAVVERQMEELNRCRKELEIHDHDLRDRLLQHKRNSSDIEELEKENSRITDTVPKDRQDIAKIGTEIDKIEAWISESEKDEKTIQKRISQLDMVSKLSVEAADKIARLDICPTCEQAVGDDYKERIRTREQEKKVKAESELENLGRKQSGIREVISKHRSQLIMFREKEKEAIRSDERLRALLKNRESIKKLSMRQDSLKREIGDINKKKLALKEMISKGLDTEGKFNAAKTELVQLEKTERQFDLELAGLNNKKEEIEKTIDVLADEIRSKLEIKQGIRDINALVNWLEEHFINLMHSMEKHVMSQLYMEFNEYFVEWFQSLIEDDAISARLDDEFSPAIMQNGYDLELEHMSGGEKTSIALAYRLALNKVINDFISHIKTKDIIILDEPTDGFSDEQLDRIRGLLDMISIPQVIIVSHEAKIEAFVDSVLRVTKTEHSSRISKII